MQRGSLFTSRGLRNTDVLFGGGHCEVRSYAEYYAHLHYLQVIRMALLVTVIKGEVPNSLEYSPIPTFSSPPPASSSIGAMRWVVSLLFPHATVRSSDIAWHSCELDMIFFV